MNMTPKNHIAGPLGKALRILALPSLLLALALPASAGRVERRFPVETRPVVTVRNFNGTLTVKSWKQNEILVVAEHTSDRVEVDTEKTGNRIEITTHALEQGLQPAELRTDYQITVPEETELQVRTDSGNVLVERVFGDLSFDTVAANLELQEVAGYLMVKTIGGSLVCVRCAGRIEFSSISGSAQLLQPVSSNVRVQTTSGSIFFDGDFLRGGLYVLKSSNGPIEVRFSEGDSFELNATSLSGRVINEASLKPRQHQRTAPLPSFGGRGNTILSGTFNEGYAKVELTSFSGTITIRRRQ